MSRLLPGIPVQDVLELGGEADPGRFNMAHLGLRLAQRANGVAKLHGAVSRRMFADLYPGFDVEEVPIGSVTNGVHLPTWQAREIGPIASDLADWRDLASAEDWPRTDLVDAGRLWAARNELRARLVTMARLAVRESWLQRGRAEAELGWTEIDPGPGHPDDRVRPPGVDLQAAHPDAARPGPAQGDPVEPGPAGADRHRRQGPPRRRRRQAVHAGDGPVLRRPGDPPTDRLPAELQHDDGLGAVRRRRCLDEHPDPAAGGLRDVGDEGRAERRAEPVHLRRLVGRAVRRAQRVDDPECRRPRRRPARRSRGVGALRHPDRSGGPAVLPAGGRGPGRLGRCGAPHAVLPRAAGPGDQDGARLRARVLRPSRRDDQGDDRDR